jgi:hypothetical protein
MNKSMIDWLTGGRGNASDNPAHGDYNGDGKADIALRAADGLRLIDYARNGFGSWDISIQ